MPRQLRPHFDNLAALQQHLLTAFPELQQLEGAMVLALNEEYVERAEMAAQMLSAGDTVALIPPISGG